MKRRHLIFPSGLTFFTLPHNYSKQIYDEIFFLVFQGGGGFSFSDCYNLPIHIRRLYLNQLIEIKQKEQEEINKSKNQSKVRRR